jgi:RNA polymerase sigma factor (TIGR02999 family)
MAQMTELLRAASAGDEGASQELFALMYDELKRLAHASLRRRGHPAELDTTALVHESYVRLAGHNLQTPSDKRAFYAYISKVMRSVVLDAVREREARKRGGDQVFVTLNTGIGEQPLEGAQLLAIGDALDALGNLAPELRELIEMRYFAGLTLAETGELLGKSPRTVQRDWQKGRLLLQRLIDEA